MIALFWNLALYSISTALLCGENIKYRLLSKHLFQRKRTTWQLKKYHWNNKLLEKITSSSYYMEQKHSSKQDASTTYTQEKKFLQLLLLKFCESFRFRQIKKLEVYVQEIIQKIFLGGGSAKKCDHDSGIEGLHLFWFSCKIVHVHKSGRQNKNKLKEEYAESSEKT